MKGLAALFLGIFGTFAFSWVGLTVIPNWQIGHLNPQSDEEGTDIYPLPQSGMVTRGARVYAANGCNYCHSQQVRAEYAGADIERKWGDRRSAPRDYIFEQPVLLAKMRMGQDLANIGARAPKEEESPPPTGGASPTAASTGAAQSPSPSTAQAKTQGGQTPAPEQQAAVSPTSAPSKSPAVAVAGTGVASPSPTAPSSAAASPGALPLTGPPWPEQTAGLPPMYSAAWHHVHLYSPRSINLDSNMPSYRFLYRTRRITDARSSDSLQLRGSDAPPVGWEVVPTFDARCLVAYMMALNQSHPLKDVRSTGAVAAASPATSPSPPPGGQPAK
ncbi:MAG TPA: cbb3-type cytochrome c oxidase subunit II [Candidatus Udaeobacter sp.]|jgi:cbb3-type cytochrome oxidase cytochrome c subunit